MHVGYSSYEELKTAYDNFSSNQYNSSDSILYTTVTLRCIIMILLCMYVKTFVLIYFITLHLIRYISEHRNPNTIINAWKMFIFLRLIVLFLSHWHLESY